MAAMVWLVPNAAAADDDPVATLPPVKRTLSAPAAKQRDCARRAGTRAKGVGRSTWKAPMDGYATVRLAGARKSDWDLAVYDKARRRYIGSSSAFGSTEVVQTWVQSGQKLLLQGCRQNGRAKRVTASVTLADLKPPTAPPTASLVRVGVPDRNAFARLEGLGLDVTHNAHKGFADVIVAGQGERDLLAKAGFASKTRVADLTARYARNRKADAKLAMAGGASLPSGQRSTYRTYSEVQYELKEMVRQHPERARAVTMPKESFQGRSVDGVEIGSNLHGTDGRPVFLLVAMHHAREWPSVEGAMEFAHMLLNEAGSDERIGALMDKVRIVVVPIVNPDGYIESRNALDPVDQIYGVGFNPNLDNPTPDPSPDENDLPTDCQVSPVLGGAECDVRMSLAESIAPPGGLFAYRRKNCDGAIGDPSVPCTLQYGVDPNRNYGQLWGGPGSDGDRTSQSYRGTGPWSEPETQNIHEFSQRRQITNIVTLHNVAALVLRPPGLHTQGFAPDEAQLKELGDKMGEATGYESQYGWQLYDTSGTTEDWNYAAQAAFGYTIEIGPKDGEFHMPYETGFVKQWNGDYAGNGKGLREALLLSAEAAADTRYHSVIAGTAPTGRILRLKKNFDTFTSPYCEEEAKVPALNYDHPIIGLLPYCVNPHDATAIPDKLDTVMAVPSNGRFTWHVNPSTRPFEGGEQHIPGSISDTPSRTDAYQNAEDLRPSQLPQQDGDDRPTYADRSFSVTAQEATKRIVISLEWPGQADDYDLEILRRESDGSLTAIELDGDGQALNTPEQVALEGDTLKPGDYVLRVHNYLAFDPEWHAKVERFDGTPDTVIPGHKESWTLTCEAPDRTVLETKQVQVDRGQAVNVDLSCGG
jgi:hypothetical protein